MARQSLMATARQTDSRISLEGRRMVSEKEWELLQKQVTIRIVFSMAQKISCCMP